MLRIGAMNLMQHGIENPNISYKDSYQKIMKIIANIH